MKIKVHKRHILLSILVLALLFMSIPNISSNVLPVSADDQWYDYKASSYAGGDGSQSSPYLIATEEQLALMNYDINIMHRNNTANFKLVSDINLGGHHWKPIGNEIVFSGVFDGNGHVIRNMSILKPSYYSNDKSTNYAFIGYCRYAVIKNVIFLHAYVEGVGDATSATIVTGDTSDSTKVENVFVIDSYIKSSAWSSGAIAGWRGRITNCYVSGTIIINKRANSGGVGGIIGYSSASIDGSYYQGYIESYLKASGIAGAETSTISNCGSYIEPGSTNVASGINYGYSSIINNCASNIALNNTSATVTNSYFGDGSNVPSSFYTDKWTSVNYINKGFPILKQFVW